MIRKVSVPGKSLTGSVSLPASKSAAHRAILCASLAKGISHLSNFSFSQDMEATCRAVEALGVKTSLMGDTLTVDSRSLFAPSQAVLDCGESGSTLRFLIPTAAAGGVRAEFTGRGRLPERPIGVYLDCLPQAGVACRTQGGLPLSISGALRPGVFRLPGNISSQFITGLLLALPILNGGSEIRLTSPLESAGYVDMTIEMMKRFGVTVTPVENGWLVPGNQSYVPRDLAIEGDWSQAAFFLAAGALSQAQGSSILLRGLQKHSTQGDRQAFSLFQRFGAKLSWEPEGLRISPGALRPIPAIDASQIPDLVPILAVTAALCPGITSITGAARLRIKESDRLKAVAQGVAALGGEIKELPDGLVVTGKPMLSGGRAEGCNDHRIVMAMAVASLGCEKPVEITDAQSVSKSYPGFFEDFISLGGKADVI